MLHRDYNAFLIDYDLLQLWELYYYYIFVWTLRRLAITLWKLMEIQEYSMLDYDLKSVSDQQLWSACYEEVGYLTL